MKLYALLEGLATALPDSEITGVSDDTRNIREGMVFVCVKGSRFDGHDAAADMLAKGATAVIAERDLGLGEQQILVSNSRKAYGDLCAAWYGHPEQRMRLMGVRGSKGKTTVTTLIQKMLQQGGRKVGLIGTVQYEIGDEIIASVNTTPLTDAYFSILAKMAAAGCTDVVMEVSSFGLEQYRIGPSHFAAAAFLNLTQDHLDVHGSMENYYLAKKMLFDRCDYALINTDDAYGKRLLSEITCDRQGFGMGEDASAHGAAFCVEDVAISGSGTAFTLVSGDAKTRITTGMMGRFNVSNAAAATILCRKLGVADADILAMLHDYTGVRGRCELIPTGREFTVICDYAHTPDAIEKVLSAMKECTAGRLIALFGCGGNRDRTKRPRMAAAAAKYADVVIVTSDNPRDEDPDAIIAEILTGLADTDVEYHTVTDRAQAIHFAVGMASAGDMIVLAGKGHEDYQIIAGGVKLHMDERELVADALAAL